MVGQLAINGISPSMENLFVRTFRYSIWTCHQWQFSHQCIWPSMAQWMINQDTTDTSDFVELTLIWIKLLIQTLLIFIPAYVPLVYIFWRWLVFLLRKNLSFFFFLRDFVILVVMRTLRDLNWRSFFYDESPQGYAWLNHLTGIGNEVTLISSIYLAFILSMK